MQDTPIREYVPVKMKTGFLEEMDVLAVYMPRSAFLELFEVAIELCREDGESDWLRQQLMPIAQRMDRFPLGTWLHPSRGCGCVVGEYLVAADVLSRADIAERMQENKSTVFFELKQLHGVDRAVALDSFGTTIDIKVRDHLTMQMTAHDHARFNGEIDSDIVVFFTDDEAQA